MVPETPEFVETEVVSSPLTGPSPVTTIGHAGLSGSVIVGFASISVYLIIYMPTFAVENRDLPGYAAQLGGIISGLVALVGAPLVGKLADGSGASG